MPQQAKILTFSGLHIDLFNLRPEDINIWDITHGLCGVNRFAGQTGPRYNVGQHSCFVSDVVREMGGGEDEIKQALLHDASEALLGDVTKWLKASDAMRPYRVLEERVQRLIYQVFRVEEEMYPRVEYADTLMVRFEGEMLFGDKWHQMVAGSAKYGPTTPDERRLIKRWTVWTCRRSSKEFLTRYTRLFE